ncbi:hypothetical protein KP509_14G076800 [Ceratopteris richardii]|uniref:Protein kinase domain-containing protein n=1 Tax=Ceratopteris richardii TaxID=49495 RepID=A0A8T2TBJ3_CERRI|nr:hypothetical protein KP509_14G076800 [Ceratopteris richardii]
MAMAGQRIVGDYVLTQELGTGSFAVVWKGKHRHTGAEVAIKEIAADKLNRKLCENLMSEINILKKTNHPNIIRLHETISQSNRIYLVLEFCAGGDLAAYINRHGKVPEATARHFMRQLGAGLQVLRANNLIHRDLKPQNLLLSTNDANAVLKIADFGFARSLQPQGMAETLCGSPLYMAPEILSSKKYDAKADLWSVGTILYQLVTGQPPFMGPNPSALLHNIQKSNSLHFPNIGLHPECIDLCRKLLRKDPVARLSFEEFFSHSFIADPVSTTIRHESIEDLPHGIEVNSSPEDSLPFHFDEEPPFSVSMGTGPAKKSSPSKALKATAERDSAQALSEKKGIFPREKGALSQRNQPLDASIRSKKLSLGPSGIESEQSPFPTDYFKDAIMDSMEVLENEYVIVSIPTTSTDGGSFAAGEQFTCGGQQAPCKNTPKFSTMNEPFSKAVTPGLIDNRQDFIASQEPHIMPASSMNTLTRIQVLNKCAETIADLAQNKCGARQYLEAFSIQLVCLAIWKEALSFSSKKACGSPANNTFTNRQHENSKLSLDFLNLSESDCGVETFCSRIEERFCAAVEQAEELSPHVKCLNGNAEIPDPMEIIYQSALTTAKNAAVDELMGNSTNAASAYSKAAVLLYFLLVEAVPLPIVPRLILGQTDRQRLWKYVELISSRTSQKYQTADGSS